MNLKTRITRGGCNCDRTDTDTDQYIMERYLPLRDMLLRCLDDCWSVETVNFTLGEGVSFEKAPGLTWPSLADGDHSSCNHAVSSLAAAP